MSITVIEFVEAWNTNAMVNGWIPCRKMTAARTQQLRLRLADDWWAENWMEALQKAGPIPGLRGVNDRGWKASVDWFLRPGTVVKIMEGVYDHWGPKATVLAGVPSASETAKYLASQREYHEKAKAEWLAKGELPKLKRE